MRTTLDIDNDVFEAARSLAWLSSLPAELIAHPRCVAFAESSAFPVRE